MRWGVWRRNGTRSGTALVAVLLLVACGGGSGSGTGDPCQSVGDAVNWAALAERNCPQLSDYRLLDDAGMPRYPGRTYAPPVALFTDYAIKQRAVFVPPGNAVAFRAEGPLSMPDGSVLVKTFSLPADTTGALPHRRLETRLLILRNGRWVGLPYAWDENQQMAQLRLGGVSLPEQILRADEPVDFTYQVPDANQCAVCHQRRETSGASAMLPISFQARYLLYPQRDSGESLVREWSRDGFLQDVPEDLSGVLRVPSPENEDISLGEHARAYLDINCRHCHSDGGGGGQSGLRLGYEEDPDSRRYGVCKRHQGYDGGGTGSGFDIVPGDADGSAVVFRLGHTAPRDRMPPTGRSLSHEEAVALVADWINSLPLRDCAAEG